MTMKNWFKRKKKEIEFPGIASSDQIYRDAEGIIRVKATGEDFLRIPAVRIFTMFDGLSPSKTL